jgi:hypothetical protein
VAVVVTRIGIHSYGFALSQVAIGNAKPEGAKGKYIRVRVRVFDPVRMILRLVSRHHLSSRAGCACEHNDGNLSRGRRGDG